MLAGVGRELDTLFKPYDTDINEAVRIKPGKSLKETVQLNFLEKFFKKGLTL